MMASRPGRARPVAASFGTQGQSGAPQTRESRVCISASGVLLHSQHPSVPLCRPAAAKTLLRPGPAPGSRPHPSPPAVLYQFTPAASSSTGNDYSMLPPNPSPTPSRQAHQSPPELRRLLTSGHQIGGSRTPEGATGNAKNGSSSFALRAGPRRVGTGNAMTDK